MFPMTVTIHSPAQLAVILGAMGGLPSPPGSPANEASAPLQARDESTSKAEQAEAGNASAQATTAAGGRRTASKDPSSDAPTKTADARASSTAESAAASPQDSTAAEPIPYAKVADAITAAVKRSRQHAVDTLKQFGATKGPELKPEQYADFLAALEA